MDDATRTVYKILKRHFEQSETLLEAWKEAARLAVTELSRAGWPGEELTRDQRAWVRFELERVAQDLSYASDAESLLKFSQLAMASMARLAPKKPTKQREKQRLIDYVKSESLKSGPSEVGAVRAATRYWKHQKQKEQETTYIPPQPENRLLDLLSLPKQAGARLPKQDLRGLILKSSLSELLLKASCFVPELWRPVLGSELSQKMKLVGFFDRGNRVILAEVSSSSVAHDLAFRKPEILARLRKIREFEHVNDLRFSIT